MVRVPVDDLVTPAAASPALVRAFALDLFARIRRAAEPPLPPTPTPPPLHEGVQIPVAPGDTDSGAVSVQVAAAGIGGYDPPFVLAECPAFQLPRLPPLVTSAAAAGPGADGDTAFSAGSVETVAGITHCVPLPPAMTTVPALPDSRRGGPDDAAVGLRCRSRGDGSSEAASSAGAGAVSSAGVAVGGVSAGGGPSNGGGGGDIEWCMTTLHCAYGFSVGGAFLCAVITDALGQVGGHPSRLLPTPTPTPPPSRPPCHNQSFPTCVSFASGSLQSLTSFVEAVPAFTPHVVSPMPQSPSSPVPSCMCPLCVRRPVHILAAAFGRLLVRCRDAAGVAAGSAAADAAIAPAAQLAQARGSGRSVALVITRRGAFESAEREGPACGPRGAASCTLVITPAPAEREETECR